MPMAQPMPWFIEAAPLDIQDGNSADGCLGLCAELAAPGRADSI